MNIRRQRVYERQGLSYKQLRDLIRDPMDFASVPDPVCNIAQLFKKLVSVLLQA